ncbi:hypothetical protein Tsubulata_008678 [Turnera subulata]|uniref:Uncharacterized protein n=1 Tax=Turnera subulata TaxID=218843 RepID=A0A9Q0F796_9ROSI|nr:hypothetical protein Tsubulata_008678 [Turnera subulata]
MYATRLLSQCQKNPSLLSTTLQPSEGPYSGYLVTWDDEDEPSITQPGCWFTSNVRSSPLKKLPLPHDKELAIYPMLRGYSNKNYVTCIFVPVLDQPLSSNKYYLLKHPFHLGKVATATKSGEKDRNCIGSTEFHYNNIYQQFQIWPSQKYERFKISPVTPDAVCPDSLAAEEMAIRTCDSRLPETSQVNGLDATLRMQLPRFQLSQPNRKSTDPLVVGEWYIPSMFVQEKPLLGRDSLYKMYLVHLEQRWVEADLSGKNVLKTDAAYIYDKKARWSNDYDTDGYASFVAYNATSQEIERQVRLSGAVVKKMLWLQEKGGWTMDKRIKDKAIKDACKGRKPYLLVETFRMWGWDNNEVLRWHFIHSHRIIYN